MRQINSAAATLSMSPSKEYKQMLQLISRNEDKLLATMTDTQKELFAKYADCVATIKLWQIVCCFRAAFDWAGE